VFETLNHTDANNMANPVYLGRPGGDVRLRRRRRRQAHGAAAGRLARVNDGRAFAAVAQMKPRTECQQATSAEEFVTVRRHKCDFCGA
jgi:hypothetical protein